MTRFRFKHILIYSLVSFTLVYGVLWTIFHQYKDLIPDIEIFILIILYMMLLIITGWVYSTKNIITVHQALGLNKTTYKYLITALIFALVLWGLDFLYQTRLLHIDIKQEAFTWYQNKKDGYWPLTFMSMVIFAPIIEEMLFRWFFLQTARQYLSDFWSAVLISLLFAGIHYSLVLFPSVFFASLLYVYLTIKSNSLIPAILAHITNNSLTFLYYSGLLHLL